MRLLWVVPRFSPDVVGGAETLVRRLVLRATPRGWSSEVATTCALNHFSWTNVLPAGVTRDDGVIVHRFPVGPRNQRRYDALHGRIVEGPTYAEELAWLAHSVWSPELGHFLERESRAYDLVVFAPYLFGTTVWGAQIVPERSVLLPCLHDEPYARLRTTRRLLATVRGCIFNSVAEQRLAGRLSDGVRGGVVGAGFDEPELPPPVGFGRSRGLGRYVLYAGRLEEGKGVGVLVDYAVRYANERGHAPKLVLIGDGTYVPPPQARGFVVRVGLVSPQERRAAYAEALALVSASRMESLSLVLLESWMEGTPAVVAVGSDVMREHCERSGGGFLFGSYERYREAIDRLVAEPDLRRAMGAAGRAYVLEHYSWPMVKKRLERVLTQLAA
jgi:glycosyltransferase involved in cell wall biosynthesis